MHGKALVVCAVLASCACTRRVTEQGIVVKLSNRDNVAGITRLRVYVSNPKNLSDHKALDFGPATRDAPVDFPNGATSLSFTVPAARTGTVDIVVEAQGRGGPEAFGWTSKTITPGGFAETEVVLHAGPLLCGNGSMDGDELCDDGNHFSGDGCSYTCQAEGDDAGTGRDTTPARADGRSNIFEQDASPEGGRIVGSQDVPDAVSVVPTVRDGAAGPDVAPGVADAARAPDAAKDLLHSPARRPCDIYAESGAPCVAAHSTVRALFSTYHGRLYRVRRESDSQELDIDVQATGVADEATLNAFCAGFTCLTTMVYDQSGHGNDLMYQGPGSAVGGQGTPALSMAESLRLGGRRVYSLYLRPGNAYWADGSDKGMPTGNAPQGIYMVTSGTHINDRCCFDYGNSKTTRSSGPPGSMNAIAFGSVCSYAVGCPSHGPWVQADFENGIFSGGSTVWNTDQKSLDTRFVTAMLKNNGKDSFALKGSDATSGKLSLFYRGSLPEGFTPMRQQGAIVLGSDGNCCVSNANGSEGTFYEGAIVAGYPPDEAEDAVQADIVAAGYAP
jgi:non-reducing end alpha-L-arabinofuranosidase